MRYIRAAIRLVAFIILTFLVYLVWFVGSFFIPNKQYWRQVCFRVWSRAFARIAGMKIEVIGPIPKPPFFLVCNHLGYMDIPALRAVADGVFVAKAEIRDWFIAGKIISDMGMIFIDRQNRRDIPRAGAKIISRLSDGEGVIVFPEGTSTKGEDVLPFNSSFLQFAAQTDLPVSYASISYRTPDSERPASEVVCWWDDTTFLSHIFRMFSLPGFAAIINFGDEPIVATDRKKLAGELRERVRERFIPVL
jgi:1-acyl-sn-glycerol-3-phosphate acyltransferase